MRNLHKKEFKTEIRRLLLDILVKETRSSKPIKIGIDLLIDKSIKIGKSDLIDIDCIDQSVEIDDTPFSFTDFMQTVNLLTIELQLRVEGSNNLLSLFKKKSEKTLSFFKKPALKSSSDGLYWPFFLFFPVFHDLGLPPFQNNLSFACSYFPE